MDNTRMQAIMAYGSKKNADEAAKEKRMKEQTDEAVSRIMSLKDRIKALMDTANLCLKNGIIVDEYADRSKSHTFVADGFNHCLGFMQVRGGVVSYMGIRNGGFCGTTDFVTDGERVFGWSNSETVHNKKPLPPRLKDMEDFLKSFDSFEANFYRYVDGKCGVTEPKADGHPMEQKADECKAAGKSDASRGRYKRVITLKQTLQVLADWDVFWIKNYDGSDIVRNGQCVLTLTREEIIKTFDVKNTWVVRIGTPFTYEPSDNLCLYCEFPE